MYTPFKSTLGSLAAACALMFAPAVQAGPIEATFTDLGGHHWSANFTVNNTISGLPNLASFTVYFDYGRATNLSLLGTPAGWDPLVVQPDAALASAGYFDALAFGAASGVASGGRRGGFSVGFDWSGLVAPAAFAFTINDPVTFAPLLSGFTASSSGTGGGGSPLPEPGTIVLVLPFIAAAVRIQSRRG
jgi:hypothetical protein